VNEIAVRQMVTLLLGELRRTYCKRLASYIIGAIMSRRVGYASIGRGMPGVATTRSKTQNIDRFARTCRLPWRELAPIILKPFLGRVNASNPLVLAHDWTHFGYLSALVTSIVVRDRAIVLHVSVTATESTRVVEERHIEELRQIIPECTPVILLADRGFGHVDYMRTLEDNRFDYVMRFAGNVCISSVNHSMLFKDIAYQAGEIQDFGTVAFRATDPHLVRVVRVRTPDELDSWNLATNLTVPPSALIALYYCRFRIEELFKDIKDTNGGFALKSRSFKSPERLEALLIVAAITHLILMLVGFYAHYRGWTKAMSKGNCTRPGQFAQWRLGLWVLLDPRYAGRVTITGLKYAQARFPAPFCAIVQSGGPIPIHTQWQAVECVPLECNASTTPISERLRQLFRERHLTQRAIAQAIGVRQSGVARVVLGTRPLPESWLPRLTQLLGTSSDELLQGTDWVPAKPFKRGPQPPRFHARTDAKMTTKRAVAK